jgi:hypothetical protein
VTDPDIRGVARSKKINLPPAYFQIGIPSDEVIAALTAGVVQIRRRAEIYESNAITPFNIVNWNRRLNTGEISVDGTRDERRQIDITLENDDRLLDEDANGGFWYDKIIKVFWGIEYYSSTTLKTWETQLGEFMVDTIDEDRFPHLTHVTGRDYTKKCLISDITQSMSFSSGFPVEQIIQALAANAGVTKFRLPITGRVFSDDTVFDVGTDRWSIMKTVADSIGYEIYFTPDGYLTMRPYQDPVLSPLSFTFKSGEDGTLNAYKRSSDDSQLKNHCIVIGATVTDNSGISTTAFGEAINDDLGSPTRRFNADGSYHMGDRVDVFTSDFITRTADAQALAESRLRVMALEEWSIDFSSLVIPWVDSNDIVAVENPDTTDTFTPTRFLLSTFKLPLGLGVMSGTAKRVTLVGTSTAIPGVIQ